MADTQRDIELRLAATTSGVDQVQRLAEQLDSLAKKGGEAAPEFQRLATELREIGAQGAAVAQITQLQDRLDSTGQSLREARENAQRLNAEFGEQSAKTQQFVQAQQAARAALDKTNEELREATAQQRLNKTAVDQNEVAIQTLAQRLAELRNRRDQEAAALRTANAAVKESNAELAASEAAAKKAQTTADRLAASYDKQQQSLNQATQAAVQAGVEITDLATAQQNLNNAWIDARQRSQQLTVAEQRLAEVTAAVAASNERAVAQARAAAAARQASTAAAGQETAELLRQRLAQEALLAAIRTGNERAVQQARAAAAARAEAARQTAAAENAAAQQTEAALLRQRLAQEAAAQAARENAEAIQQAFGTVGVRSAETIRAEIQQVIAALNRLRSDTSISGAEFDRAFKQAQVQVANLERELRGLPPLLRQTDTLAGALRQSLSQFTAAFGAFELGRGFIDANNRLETLRRSLTILTGSTETAAQQIEFLKQTSDRAGLSYNLLAQDFVNFSAAATNAGVALEQQNAVFGAVANAAGQLGISTDRVGLILQALAQTASKGKVSLEELQGQLGESLPGALKIVANGFGVTTAQLLELVKGGVDAESFFDAFVRGTNEAFGDGTQKVEGFAAAWNRFKNTLSETATFLGDSGVIKGLAFVLDQLAATVRGLVGATDLLGRSLGITAAAIANFDLTRPIESFRNWRSAIVQAADEIQGKLDQANGKIASSADQTVEAQNQVAGAAQGAATALQANAGAQTAAANAATANAAAQSAAAQGAASAGSTANSAAAQWAQLTLAYKQNLAEAENQIRVAVNIAEAKKIEGQSRIEIARIAGDEAQTLQVVAQAARGEAEALADVADRRQAEINLLQSQADRVRDLIAAQGDASGARTKELTEITQTIAGKQAEIEKSRETAEAARLEAAARDVAVQAYRDNSAAVDQLRAAYEASQRALATVRAAEQQGLATQAQVQSATERAASAEALYRDALRDSASALDRKVRAAQGSLSVTEGQIALQRTIIEGQIAEAEATGNSARVLEGTIALKQLDIQLLRAKAQALQIEAQALRAQAQAELDALKANDPLLAQKRAEIELRLQNAKAKELEGAKNLELIRQIEAEIERLQQRASVSGITSNQYVNDREKEINALDRTRRSVDALAEAERKRRGVDANGFSTDTQGRTINAAGNTFSSIYNSLKSRGLDDQTAARIAREFTDENGDVPFFNNPGQLKYGGKNSTLDFAVAKAADKALMATAGRTRSQSPTQPTQPTQDGAGSQSYTVKIELGGRTTTINTASQADAANLSALLQQIGDAANRAGP